MGMRKLGGIILFSLLLSIRPNISVDVNNPSCTSCEEGSDLQLPVHNALMTNEEHRGIGATTFFSNLRNIPYNQKGSCAYVALAMVLDFYDTTVNDNIVPDQYILRGQATSPINFYKYSPGNAPLEFDISSDAAYNEDIENHVQNDIQSKMFKNVKDELGKYQYSINSDLYGAAMKGFATGLNYEMNVYRKYSTESDMTATYRLKDIAIDIIREGRPVILYTKTKDFSSYHAVVAHNYDKYNDLLVHFGWVNIEQPELMDTNVTLSTHSYKYIDTVIDFDFSNVPHVHSKNYMFAGSFYCGCNVINLLDHHYTWTITDTSHYGYCQDCKNYVNEAHSFQFMGYYYQCTKCGFQKSA